MPLTRRFPRKEMKYCNIPIFVPHKGCPFDCVFCNQKHITGTDDEVNEEYIKNTIEEHLKTLPKEDCTIEAAFFGGSFTGIDSETQTMFLSAAYEYVKNGSIDGIRLSTRPDYIDTAVLERLKKYGVTTIELGVQSMNKDVLEKSHRGHTREQVIKACSLIRKYPFKLGLQMMTGLPGDTPERSMQTADEIIALKPDFVRIYPTLVVRDTYLEKMYIKGEYRPQTVEEACALCKGLLKKFNDADITVIRIALQTTDEISPGGSITAGPFDAQFRERVEAMIYYDKMAELLKTEKKNNICILVNDKEVSKAVGHKKENIAKLKKAFGINVKIKGSTIVKKGCCEIYDG